MSPAARAAPGGWRLLAPALLAWAATAWAIAAPGRAAWVAAVAGVGGALLLVSVLRRAPRLRRFAGVWLVAAGILLVLGARVAGLEAARADPRLIDAASAARPVTLVVHLDAFPADRKTEFGARAWVRASTAMGRAATPMRLYLAEAAPREWAPGTPLRVVGIPQATDPGDPAAFTLRVSRAEVAAVTQPLAQGSGAIAAALRHGLRDAASTVAGAELVPGFAVGDTSLVPEDLANAMLASSLSHLTAVSGANCALVTGALLWTAARCGVGRRARIALAGVGLAAFVTVVGPDASVQRAAVMASVLLLSGFGGKRSVALPALGAAVCVLLMVDPWHALQPGFALSVAATGGILLAAQPLTAWGRRRLRLPTALALPIAVAVAAQFACGPLLLLLQPGIPAVGVLANVLAAPAAPVGTGLGLLALVTLPVLPPLGAGSVHAASLAARWVAATAEVTSVLPGARWPWPEGTAGALLLAACQATLGLAWALHRGALRASPRGVAPRRRPWGDPERPPLVQRSIVAGLAALACGVMLAVTVVTPLAERWATPGGWAVVACDVGQGDAMLLRSPLRPDQVMLVDTGDDPARLRACLDRFGVGNIDLLVLSHDDRDHVGALAAVADRVERALIAPDTAAQRIDGRPLRDALEAAGIPVRIGEAGAVGGFGAGPSNLRWEVLAPAAGATPNDTNAASLVVRVEAGPIRTLLLGDTGREEHDALLASAVNLSADVIKVAHHGSSDQAAGLPARVRAAWALVSVGADNGYGHPAADTLDALARAGSRTLRTDLHGSIAVIPAGNHLRTWVERAP